MMTALQNKTVVITAGNRGGGLALSQKYAENSANVVMIADKSDLVSNHAVFPEKSELIAVDFADEKQIEDAVNTIIAQFGSLDILINNFSIFNFKSTMGTTPEMFYSVTHLTHAPCFITEIN